MKHLKAISSVVAVVALLVAGGATVAGEENVTMAGGFVWERGDGDISGDLKAVFSPSGEGTWDVTFTFDWEDEPREWKGTAKGSLSSGSLAGEALEDRDRKRTFKFSGQVSDGVFKGEHGAIRDGELQKRGTLELKAP